VLYLGAGVPYVLLSGLENWEAVGVAGLTTLSNVLGIESFILDIAKAFVTKGILESSATENSKLNLLSSLTEAKPNPTVNPEEISDDQEIVR
jgi:hypothetical protein